MPQSNNPEVDPQLLLGTGTDYTHEAFSTFKTLAKKNKFKFDENVFQAREYARRFPHKKISKIFRQCEYNYFKAQFKDKELSGEDIIALCETADRLCVKRDYSGLKINESEILNEITQKKEIKIWNQTQFDILKKHFADKILTRTDVELLLATADRCHVTRDLSGLNLSDCDLTDLDLRKTKLHVCWCRNGCCDNTTHK